MKTRNLRICLLAFLASFINVYAGPPEPELGQRWVRNDQYSDEFNGNQLDETKWNKSFKGWNGRQPAYFNPNTISVSGGNMIIRNQPGVPSGAGNGYTMSGGAVQSKNETSHFGYYECSFRASKVNMSTTFWLSSSSRPETRTGDGNDTYSQELDICESIGGTGNFSSDFRKKMKFNTHYRLRKDPWPTAETFYSRGNNQVEIRDGDLVGGDASLVTSESWEAFHTYACDWRNAQDARFFVDDRFIGVVKFRTDVVSDPFKDPMRINMVTETYNWATPHPTDAQLNNNSINASYYDWVRTYVTLPVDQVTTLDAEGAAIFTESIEMKDFVANRASASSYNFVGLYKANVDRDVHIIIRNALGNIVSDSKYRALSGFGKKRYTVNLSSALSQGNYTVTIEERPVNGNGASVISSEQKNLTIDGGNPTPQVNPQPGWADSYSAGGKCYCATTFDHGIGDEMVQTPAGLRSVRDVCDKIGPGPGKGTNPVYNTVNCGNAPAHEEAININGQLVKDEVVCPGRVDQGASGCAIIGPKWDLSVFETTPPTNTVSVDITTPTTASVGQNIPVTISTVGAINKHQVYVNGALVDTDGSNYTNFVITSAAAGTYAVRVVVNDGAAEDEITITVGSSNPDPNPNPPINPTDCKVYEEINGVVAVEAEDFVSQTKTSDREWFIISPSTSGTPTPDPDANHATSASNDTYVELLPDTRVTHSDPLVNGVSFSNTPGEAAILNYKVYFNSPGKYFVWVRAHSTGSEDNGIHVGIDGNWPSSGARMQWCAGKNAWTWESKQRTNANHCGVAELIFVNVPSAGEHTINFSMREDGFEFDKFVLSKTYTKPSGDGPAIRPKNNCDQNPDPNPGDCPEIDLCPNNPNKTAPGICGCDAPETSNCLGSGTSRPVFNKSRDLLIPQFDSKPDPDDIHAQAALGSMLSHKDLQGVNYYAVAGAYGIQNGNFIDSDNLFDLAFGAANWTDADADRNGSVTRIVNKVIPILQNGGQVWVQEAGQSNITADWVKEVQKTVNNAIVKSNVIVVQHSKWNQDQTATADLDYVRNNTNYFYIDDGNAPFTASWGDHGVWQTPEYRSRDTKWLIAAENSANPRAKALWLEAARVIDSAYPNGIPYDWSFMKGGGLDYSDCAENWWIFSIGDKADDVTKFWDRYVTNTTDIITPKPGGCTSGNPEPPINNIAPSVSFANINDGDIFNAGDSLAITVNASDSDGTVSDVQLLLNGTLVRQENVAPYNWGVDDVALQNLSTGDYVLEAIATDDDGATSSTIVNITVGSVTPIQEDVTLITASSYSAGNTLTFDVDYSAAVARDIAVEIRDSQGAWLTISVVTVQAGSGTATLTLTRNAGFAAGNGYRVLAMIREVGQDWRTNIDTDTKTINIEGTTPQPEDCAGVAGGTASLDACGICSGGTTGITPSSPTTWYADVDGDGLGDASSSVEDCNQPIGYVAVAGDICPTDGDKIVPGACGCGVAEGTCTGEECIEPAYSSSTIYSETGTRVNYQGKVYQNKWYTQGDLPGSLNGPWEVVGFCGATSVSCTDLPIYNTSTAYSISGTEVVYQGDIWSNQWYTQGQTPGTNEVWVLTAPCSENNLRGSNKSAESVIEVLPNPATDVLKIYGTLEGELIQIIDVHGHVMLGQIAQNETTEIRLDQLPAAIYVVSTQGKKVTFYKL